MALVLCPGCERHIHSNEPVCPFCGGDASGARPGAVRGISRRQLTRAAVWTGAALLLGACGEQEPDRGQRDGTGGGEDALGVGDDDDGVVVIDARDPDHVVVVDDGRDDGGDVVVDADVDTDDTDLVDDQLDVQRDWRDRRRRRCPEGDDMACMAMPYGAPPSPDAFV